MTLTAEKTVRDLALEIPSATRVFEKMGIDYCCGGGQSLEQACRTADVPMAGVLEALESAERDAQPRGSQPAWQEETLAALIAHIQNTHHQYTREECVRLRALTVKVASVHGERHPELARVRDVFEGWRRN